MNKKRFALCLLLFAGLLAGCHQTVEPEPLPTRSTEPLISIPQQTTEPTTEATTQPTVTVPGIPEEPVTLLSSIKWRTVPQLLSLGEGQVLACRNYFVEGTGIINFLDVVDVINDTILGQITTDSPKELVQQQFEDGHFILRDTQANTFDVYNRNLQVTNTFTAPNVDGYFSYDRQNYYFINNDVLYRMDVATGNYGRMALEYDLQLDSLITIHPQQNILVAKFYRSFYDDSWGVCAIDANNGRFLLLNEDISYLWFDNEQFYAAMTNDQVYGSDICYGSLSGNGVLQKASSPALGSDTVSYTMLSGSGILMLHTVDEENLSTTVYDLSRDGISSQLAQYGYETSTLGAVYLPQEQLIMGVYPDGYDFSAVLINPNALSYEKSLSINKEVWPALVDRAVVLNYQDQVKGPALDESLSALRQQADQLEQQYNVKLLMANQTEALYNEDAAVVQDPTMIGNALNALDRQLALYPNGFFKQFQNGIGQGGVYFSLTGQIQGSLEPTGKAVQRQNRYEILLDITSQNLESTIHHELWHAIEMKISTDCFDAQEWDALNPQDFVYYGHYDSGYRNLTQWTYAQSGDQCYFVDAYACINAREDRARIMEYVMTNDASDLLRAPGIQRKLQIMITMLRNAFDTTDWQVPRWEQHL